MAIVTGTEGYGGGPYEIPDPKETGNSVFDKLEQAIERLATHTHQGIDSSEITLNIAKGVQELLAGADFVWDQVGTDKYRAAIQTDTGTSAGATFDDNVRTYYYRSGGSEPKQFFPTIEKIDNTNYYIYSNDNTIDLKVITL